MYGYRTYPFVQIQYIWINLIFIRLCDAYCIKYWHTYIYIYNNFNLRIETVLYVEWDLLHLTRSISKRKRYLFVIFRCTQFCLYVFDFNIDSVFRNKIPYYILDTMSKTTLLFAFKARWYFWYKTYTGQRGKYLDFLFRAYQSGSRMQYTILFYLYVI